VQTVSSIVLSLEYGCHESGAERSRSLSTYPLSKVLPTLLVGCSRVNLIFVPMSMPSLETSCLKVLAGRDVMGMPLSARREFLDRHILSKLGEPIRESPELRADLKGLVASVCVQGFEGLVAKRRDSRYEPGQRSGAWQKMRINKGQEFVIAGYTLGGATFDALVFGYYQGSKLLYVSRTRNGFTPRLREDLLKRFRGLEITECPFANLPEPRGGRWGQGLTAAKMEDCKWIKPVLVGQFEFTEWTPDNHLRHARFVALRDDKKPIEVRREG
jgi:ATP-dependent DNA ligase